MWNVRLAIIRGYWLTILVSFLGAAQMLMALSARPGPQVVGLVGGLAVIASPWVARRSRRVAGGLLVVGAGAFAVLTYWAVVPVLVALLVVVVGIPVVLRGAPGRVLAGRQRPA